MSRLIAAKADELLSGVNSNVTGDYNTSDSEVPGRVILANPQNAITDPDLTDTGPHGRLRSWNQDAPPSPDSWNVYIRKVQRVPLTGPDAGNYVVIDDPAPMLRQNESILRMKEHTYNQDHPLVTNKSLPDLHTDRDTDLAAPIDAPRVEAVLKASGGGGGYPASLSGGKASYVGILGDHPMESSRITAAAPAVTLPTIAQGQNLLFYLPDEIPDSWTGIAFVVGSTISNMRIQKRVDIRGKVITQVIDRGPYRKDGRVVDTTNPVNRTQAGAYRQFFQPDIFLAHSGLNLDAGNYIVSYRLVTKQGITASQDVNSRIVNITQEGTALCWKPHKGAFQQEGVTGWIPQFKGLDNKWYTLERAKGGYPRFSEARIWTTDTKNWKGHNKPVHMNLSEVDRSGVPNPKDPMEVPVAKGAENITPGKYAVRVTNANQKEDMESAPSPRTVVSLPDAGGGSPSGVTDHMIRVFRPHPQTIRNSRLMEVDPATGNPNLHWDTFSSAGATITDGDGFIQFAESDAAGTNFSPIRRTAAEPVDPTRFYTLRWRMSVTRYGAGTIQVAVRFLDSSKTQISQVVMEAYTATGDNTERRTLGPNGGMGQIDFPTNAAYIQIVLIGLANRNYDFTMSNIGAFVGRSSPKKVYDLVLSQNTPHKDVWPVPDEALDTPATAQTPNLTTSRLPYPAGPYTRTIAAPTDPANHRAPSYLEQKGFEDGSATSGGWTVATTTGGTFTAGTGNTWALRGLGGALSNVTASSVVNYNAAIWSNYLNAGRNTFGVEVSFRIKALPSSGSATILGVTKAADLVTYLARLQITSAGLLQYRYFDGTSEVAAASTGYTLQAGDDVRLELQFGGLRTNSGTLKINVKRNDRPATQAVSLASIQWLTGAQNVNRVIVGWQNGSTATATARALVDRIRITDNGVTETTPIPGNLQQYWAPEGQPAHSPDHMITGLRWPVKPAQARVFSFYGRYQGITTPSAGASLFRLVSHDKDGNPIKDHGWGASGWLGRDHWDRYYNAYTTPSVAAGDTADAAYVECTRNDIGDGFIEVMGFQDQLGTTPTAFDRTITSPGSLQVVFDTTLSGGPLGGDTSWTKQFLRARAVTTDAPSPATTTFTLTARAGNTLVVSGGTYTLSGGTFVTASNANIQAMATTNRYVELKLDITTSNTSADSPEVMALFLDVVRTQPFLLMENGSDFNGGILVYALTPASPRPNVIRKEYADGEVGLEYVGRGNPAKVLKLSCAAYTDRGKEQAEKNAATDEPLFQVETATKRYTIGMVPEFTGSVELSPDGTYYWEYTAEGIEADVMHEDSL